MAHDLLTRESPEIIRFFQDIEYLTEISWTVNRTDTDPF